MPYVRFHLEVDGRLFLFKRPLMSCRGTKSSVYSAHNVFSKFYYMQDKHLTKIRTTNHRSPRQNVAGEGFINCN